MKIELSEEQVNNTLIFLRRVNVKGAPVVEMAILQQKFQQALDTALLQRALAQQPAKEKE